MNIFEAQGALTNAGNLGDKEFNKRLENFMIEVRKMEMNQPEVFQQWYEKNPEWGMRYDAQMATGRHFVGDHPWKPADTKVNRARAEATALKMGIDAGFGDDGKQDGKAFASGYNTMWNDVNNEGGYGDFMKIGTPSAMKGGFLDFVEDNPAQVAAMVAGMAMPWLTPYVSTALGITSTLGNAALTAGMTTGVNLLGGQDLDDALMAGVLSGGTYYLKNAADVTKMAQGVADNINSTVGTTLDAQDVINSGLAVVKQSPEGLMEVVIPQGMDQVFDSMKPVSDWMNENGWSTDAITDAMVKYAKSGGDVQKAALEWVKEGGVGDIPLPDIDIDLNLPDWGGDLDWSKVTDPIKDAVSNIPNPFGNVNFEENWEKIEDPLQNAYENIEGTVQDTVEALPWPSGVENPLPEFNNPLPNINLPEIPKPEGDFDLGSLLPLAAGLIPLLGGKDGDNGPKKFDVSGIPGPAQAYQPGNIQLPDYSAYGPQQRKPGFQQPSRDIVNPTWPVGQRPPTLAQRRQVPPTAYSGLLALDEDEKEKRGLI